MLIRIAKRKTMIRQLLQKQSDLGLSVCLCLFCKQGVFELLKYLLCQRFRHLELQEHCTVPSKLDHAFLQQINISLK